MGRNPTCSCYLYCNCRRAGAGVENTKKYYGSYAIVYLREVISAAASRAVRGAGAAEGAVCGSLVSRGEFISGFIYFHYNNYANDFKTMLVWKLIDIRSTINWENYDIYSVVVF